MKNSNSINTNMIMMLLLLLAVLVLVVLFLLGVLVVPLLVLLVLVVAVVVCKAFLSDEVENPGSKAGKSEAPRMGNVYVSAVKKRTTTKK